MRYPHQQQILRTQCVSSVLLDFRTSSLNLISGRDSFISSASFDDNETLSARTHARDLHKFGRSTDFTVRLLVKDPGICINQSADNVNNDRVFLMDIHF